MENCLHSLWNRTSVGFTLLAVICGTPLANAQDQVPSQPRALDALASPSSRVVAVPVEARMKRLNRPPIKPTEGETQALVNPNPIPYPTNIRVFPSAVHQAEVHLSADPTNPLNIVAACNALSSSGAPQVQVGHYFSADGGYTWSGQDVLPQGAATSGDPATAYDALGKAYITTMRANGDGYQTQTSTNPSNAASWSTPIQGTVTGVSNFDKEMVVADDMPSTQSNYSNYFYATWIDFGSTWQIRFNRSIDRGQSYSSPIVLRSQGAIGSSTSFGQGANVQTGPNGQVYVCWSDYGNVDTNTQTNTQATGIGFTKSLDGGATFTPFTVPIACVGIRDTWLENPLFNDTKVPGYPSMAVDKSCVHPGRIYITFPAKENGTGKSVVQVVYSDNQGAVGSWSAPVTVSIPAAVQSWLPWIAVDPGTGEISLIYYAIESATTFATNTYVAYSANGGATFTNTKVSDVAHTTAPISYSTIGYWNGGLDYIGITARNGRACPIWSDDRNGTWQLYAAQLKYYSIVGPGATCASNSLARYTLLGNSISNQSQPPGSTITWSTSPAGAFTPATGSGPDFTTSYSNLSGNGIITATVTLACGGSFTTNMNVHSNACRGVATYPNPTDKGVTVEVPAETSGTTGRYTAQLYNQQGKMERQTEWVGSQQYVDTSTLPDGLYYLMIRGGATTERRSILVQH